LASREVGNEWEPIIILLLRENSAYTPISQPRIPTRVCQGHVVTTDLTTLGTNPKRPRSESTNQEAKDLAVLQIPWRTVRDPGVDGPRLPGGRSVKHNRMTRRALKHADGPYLIHGRSVSNWCCADGPRRPGGRSAKYLSAKNSWPTGSKRKRSRMRDEHEEHLDELHNAYSAPATRGRSAGTGTATRA
jgi:hypothetical protein